MDLPLNQRPSPASLGTWNEDRVAALIQNGVEESLTLEYKAAAALGKDQEKKIEITKDASAFANSAGGTLVYGIAEHSSKARKHLPERLDPVDRSSFSREWLEHVIGNIRPRIQGLVIHPVILSTGPTHVVYVVEVPQSTTAHQATDLRYYRRFNFEAVPMADHEIRDVMSRSQHPRIVIEFSIDLKTKQIREKKPYGFEGDVIGAEMHRFLNIRARNAGQVLARFVNAFVELPASALHQSEPRGRRALERRPGVLTIFVDNTQRDVLDITVDALGKRRTVKYGPSWFEPILPGLALLLSTVRLADREPTIEELEVSLEWTAHADNATPEKGEWSLGSIQPNVQRNAGQDRGS